MGDGDAVSVVGALSSEIFDWRGEKRISLRLLADRALALKPKPKKATPQDGRPPLEGGPDDDVPF
jgi:hypothetical protein